MKFKNMLSLILLVGVIPGMWIAQGLGFLMLNGEVTGATVIAWGLILEHYYEDNKAKSV